MLANALLVLTETRVETELALKRVLVELHKRGYATASTHGVRGLRKERGGIIVAWDRKRLHTRPLTARKGVHSRTVAAGRALQLRFYVGTAREAASSTGHSIDLVAAYMPPRGSGPKGHTSERARGDVERAWRLVMSRLVTEMQGGMLLFGGDLNSELLRMLLRRRGGRGAIATPSDLLGCSG